MSGASSTWTLKSVARAISALYGVPSALRPLAQTQTPESKSTDLTAFMVLPFKVDFTLMVRRFEAPWREAFALEAEAAARMETAKLLPLLQELDRCLFPYKCTDSVGLFPDQVTPGLARAPLLRKFMAERQRHPACALETGASRRVLFVTAATCAYTGLSFESWVRLYREQHAGPDKQAIKAPDAGLKVLLRALRDLDTDRVARWTEIDSVLREFPMFFNPSRPKEFRSALDDLRRLDYPDADLSVPRVRALLQTRDRAFMRLRQSAVALREDAVFHMDLVRQKKADYDKSLTGRFVKSRLGKFLARSEAAAAQPELPAEVLELFEPSHQKTTLTRHIEEELERVEKVQEQQAADLARAERANVRVENEAQLLFVDLLLETGLVFALAGGQEQVPAWLLTEAARALGTSESQVLPKLAALSSDLRFLESWRLDGSDGTFDGFRLKVLAPYRVSEKA
jgi:hypothetical protein